MTDFDHRITRPTRRPKEAPTEWPRGLFIVVDGPSCSGKSSVLEPLAIHLANYTQKLVVTFSDPTSAGDSPTKRALLEARNDPTTTPARLATLYTCNRKDLWDDLADELQEGNHVICDRWTYATIAYQHRVHTEKIIGLHDLLEIGWPDIVLLLGVSYKEFLRRRALRRETEPERTLDDLSEDEFTRMALEYRRIARGYQDPTPNDPYRRVAEESLIYTVETTGLKKEEVEQECKDALSRGLDEYGPLFVSSMEAPDAPDSDSGNRLPREESSDVPSGGGLEPQTVPPGERED